MVQGRRSSSWVLGYTWWKHWERWIVNGLPLRLLTPDADAPIVMPRSMSYCKLGLMFPPPYAPSFSPHLERAMGRRSSVISLLSWLTGGRPCWTRRDTSWAISSFKRGNSWCVCVCVGVCVGGCVCARVCEEGGVCMCAWRMQIHRYMYANKSSMWRKKRKSECSVQCYFKLHQQSIPSYFSLLHHGIHIPGSRVVVYICDRICKNVPNFTLFVNRFIFIFEE